MGEEGTRARKREILKLLQSDAFDQSLDVILGLPGRQVINPLFSMLCHRDPFVRWRSVIAMGAVLEKLARVDLEGARVVMRRLMWSLNDESGGIGWGAPEVMGEAMAQSEILAKEYASMLGSYADETGNFLEHEPLQRGLMWAWVRLAGARPAALSDWKKHLVKYLESKDPVVRGHAVMATGELCVTGAKDQLTSFMNDETEFETFRSDKIVRLKMNDVVRKTIQRLEKADELKTELHCSSGQVTAELKMSPACEL